MNTIAASFHSETENIRVQDIHSRLYSKLCAFLEDLIVALPHNNEVVLARIYIGKKPATKVAQKFIRKIMPFKQYIKANDAEGLFKNHKDAIKLHKFFNIQTIWNELSHDNRTIVIAWLSAIVDVADEL